MVEQVTPIVDSPPSRSEARREYLASCLDDPWMATLLRRHGLHGGRTTVVLLLMFEAAGLPPAVVGDFLGTLGRLAEPKAVLEEALAFLYEVSVSRCE
jgi:hypothetical protein